MRRCILLALLVVVPGFLAVNVSLAAFSESELERAREMLRLTRDEVVGKFHDPARVGKDFRTRCDETERNLTKARSTGEARLMIAQLFLDLGDSYTRFVPPHGFDRVNHHWSFHAVGREIYVREVDRGSDAETKGLRAGDKLLAIDGIAPTRSNRGLLEYLIYGLEPRSGMRVIAQAPGQEPRRLDIAGETVNSLARGADPTRYFFDYELFGQKTDPDYQSRLDDLSGGILVWKLRKFDPKLIARGLRKAESARVLVLDLRGNSPSKLLAVEDLLKGVFAEEFDAYTTQQHTKTKTVRVKGKGQFKGLLLVLIDNGSASAAEIFSRVVQQRQRGVLLGDHTAGRLLTAEYHSLVQTGLDNVFTIFGATIAETGATMADGTVIEGKGVAPDYLLLPTHEQLYLGHDPVLAKALSIAGRPTTPEEAGKLFSPLKK
jgi:C-terminal processing protease CtpA/Prc